MVKTTIFGKKLEWVLANSGYGQLILYTTLTTA